MRFFKDHVTCRQECLQGFFGGLLAVIDGRIQIRFLAFHKATRRSDTALAFDQPLADFLTLSVIHTAPYHVAGPGSRTRWGQLPLVLFHDWSTPAPLSVQSVPADTCRLDAPRTYAAHASLRPLPA